MMIGSTAYRAVHALFAGWMTANVIWHVHERHWLGAVLGGTIVVLLALDAFLSARMVRVFGELRAAKAKKKDGGT